MAIEYHPDKGIFALHTKDSTYQILLDRHGYLLHAYYGARETGMMDYAVQPIERGFSGTPPAAGEDRAYSLDTLPQEYPVLGPGDHRRHALTVENADGSLYCDLRFSRYEIRKGKYRLPGLPAVWAEEDRAQTLEIVLNDRVSGVEVSLLYGVLEEENILTRSAVIRNGGTGGITLRKAAGACLDFVTGEFDLLRFHGRHNMERNLERTPIPHGLSAAGSSRGTSSHHYDPGIILAEPSATEDAGMCYGMLLVYSGNFLWEVEKDAFGQTRALLGLNDELFAYPLAPGEAFTVPEAILSFSDKGLGALSRQYHACIRDHVCRGPFAAAPGPIVINSWEAAYFDFTGETVVRFAKEASELGIDLVVMDDGWFGKRDDDTASLGDWYANEEKLGCTLEELTRRVCAQGVKFGIWIEPEMVSQDSALYRAHPDWAMQIPGRAPVRSRSQLVLDFSRREVREHILEKICALLDRGGISYVKWDMNRSISDVYAGHVTHDYVLGLYDVLERLTARYPDILVESCSGGGGRFDAGMLYYTPQIWCSDDTDAVCRTKIQYGASFFYPVSVMGAHVAADPHGQTGRHIPFKTRGIVAMTGAFGYELDPARLTHEEKDTVREQIKTYRTYQDLICRGDHYRLSDPCRDPCAAWMFVSPKQDRALVSAVRLTAEGNMPRLFLRLRGLKREAVYREEESGRSYTGSALMRLGLPLPPLRREYEAYQFFLKKQT